ncbi:DUF1508 domain-containing protein [Pedobacter sp. PLR]|uniref:YegP family protein n=1 Tax=Pedobacter sp. PLR TaxID=2994465 RepID=UPI00224692C1|nr:DUF1508 domain-containing protein [Pedobacter sp. PLR]MCX2454147.1 DUF1508 domain-containing protein [Pedobacter sp. PLR]
MAKFQIIKDLDNKFHFNLKLKSGDIVLRSTDKTVAKISCEKQVELVRANSQFAQRFSRQTDDQGSFFILKDADNQVLGRSGYYTYWLDMERSIAAVRSYTHDAELEDLSAVAQGATKGAALDLVAE